jgi:flagellar protein FliO/FliZ
MGSFALSFAGMLLALAGILALAWTVLHLVRARMRPRSSAPRATDDALRFVRALSVGAKERVVIVEHRGARWMLGVTGGSISMIAHWPSTAASDASDDRCSDAARADGGCRTTGPAACVAPPSPAWERP